MLKFASFSHKFLNFLKNCFPNGSVTHGYTLQKNFRCGQTKRFEKAKLHALIYRYLLQKLKTIKSVQEDAFN